MQNQIPNGNLVIGNALDGSIGKFYLCQSSHNVPMDPELFENCIIKTEFTKDKINGTELYNNGTAGNLTLTSKPQYILRQKTIGNPGDKLQLGSLSADV